MSQGGGREIIVLDDEERETRVISELLLQHRNLRNVTIHLCTSIKQCFTLMHDGIGMVITDLLMPENGQSAPSGRQVVARIKTSYPHVDVVVLTSKREIEEAVLCMRLGATHYLVKDQANYHRLPDIVSEILDLRPSARSVGFHCDNLITHYWSLLQREDNPAQRGTLLECVTKLLFDTCAGLRVHSTRFRGHSEEFDIVVRPDGRDPSWAPFGQIILVECKCLQRPVQREEFDAFNNKLERRRISKLGIFVSWSGFTSGFQEQVRHGKHPIVMIDWDRLVQWIRAEDRSAFLQKMVIEEDLA